MEQVNDSGLVLQLQSFSVHDGDGIRTTVFLHGCPLRCKWCANPDSWTMDETKCRRMTAEEVLKKISRDEIFYRFSNGGVTFSGGEPTVQHEFLRGLVQKLEHRGIDMWIETCGYFDWYIVHDIFDYFSHVFLDIKCMDSNLHRELTGKENQLILDNARRIFERGCDITIRIPVMKNVNFTEENLAETAAFMKKYLPCADIELLPYHNLGHEKYKAHGLEDHIYDYVAPSKEELAKAEEMLRDLGVKTISYK